VIANPIRITFQSTPVERFAAELAVIRDRIDDLPNEVVAQVLAELDRLRRRTLAEMADAAPETFDVYRLGQLEAGLRRAMQNFVDHYQTILTPAQQEAYGLGAELVARPLQASGLIVPTPQLSRRQIEAMQGFQARLITNVGDATIGEITTDVRVGLLRGESVPEIMRRVAGRLPDQGPFASLALRAEAITRTELGRIQAMATQASLEQTQRLVPDLMKEWKHSRNKGKDARDGHIEADGQRVYIKDAFRVRPSPEYPYEKLQFPRDPAGSPRSTVNCGCVVVPYRKAWEEFEREPRRPSRFPAKVTVTRS
jgi:hypothetical protein